MLVVSQKRRTRLWVNLEYDMSLRHLKNMQTLERERNLYYSLASVAVSVGGLYGSRREAL